MPTATEVFEAIAHGDEEHRGWLREALDNIFAGKPVPEPRGSNTSDALRGRIYQYELALTTIAACQREAREGYGCDYCRDEALQALRFGAGV